MAVPQPRQVKRYSSAEKQTTLVVDEEPPTMAHAKHSVEDLEAVNLRQLQREAARHGGHIEDDGAGDECTYQCCSPRGHVWAGDGLHMLKITWCDRGEKDAALQDGIDRMRNGIAPCTDTDCQLCTDDAADGNAADLYGGS